MGAKEEDIRIYVACLAAYNNGVLHGAWIDADQDFEQINNTIRDMLAASPIAGAEEFAIHDHDGFEGVNIGEYQSIDSVADIAAFISERGALGAMLINHFGDLEFAREAMAESYHGCYRSVAEFAEQLADETMEIPQSLIHYIDYEAMARDLEINDVLAIETGLEEVHVFWRC